MLIANVLEPTQSCGDWVV